MPRSILFEIRPRDVTLSVSDSRDGDGHMVKIGEVTAWMTPAELSELGHRFIELAAQAEEREQGVEAVA